MLTGNAELLVFSGVIALGQMSPGPDLILVTRTALKKGTAAGLRTACGIALGLSVHATLAVAGVAVAFDRLPVLSLGMRWLAAVYLLWIARGLFVECLAAWQSTERITSPGPDSRRSAFVQGLLCNLLNPKVALFLMAVCAPFLGGKHPSWWPLVIWLLVVGQGLMLWALWVLLLQWQPLRRGYERMKWWLDAAFGAGLVCLAAKLVFGS